MVVDNLANPHWRGGWVGLQCMALFLQWHYFVCLWGGSKNGKKFRVAKMHAYCTISCCFISVILLTRAKGVKISKKYLGVYFIYSPFDCPHGKFFITYFQWLEKFKIQMNLKVSPSELYLWYQSLGCRKFVINCPYSFWCTRQAGGNPIYLPTPVDFKTLVDLQNFLAPNQHHHLLLLLWKKNAARKF